MNELLKKIRDLMEEMNVMERLLTYKEAADILNIKPQTLRQWVCAQRIGYIKIGSAVRFSREDIEAFIANSTVEKLR